MLFLTIFSFLKNFWTNLLDFANTKIGKIVLLVIAILICLLCIYKYGYNKGVENEQNKQKIAIENALKEQLKRSEIEKKETIKLVESNKITEKIYIKVKDNVKDIKDRNPQLSSEKCKLPEEDGIKFNQALDEIK